MPLPEAPAPSPVSDSVEYRFMPTTEDPDDPRCAELMASTDMREPVYDQVMLSTSLDAAWEEFLNSKTWSSWNRCFFWVHTQKLEKQRHLVWIFQPIRWWMLYKMPAMAKIVELDHGNGNDHENGKGHGDQQDSGHRRVTWTVTILPGFYARHSYFMQEIGEGKVVFGSWEKAMGPSYRLLRRFWTAHFEFVCGESIAGARKHLEGR